MTSVPERAKASRGFPSPLEVEIPPVCEGWEEMYATHAVFSDDRRGADEARFWFQDGIHCPEPLYPFDSLWFDCAIAAFNQANTRLFVVPPSLGLEYRLLNGYLYLSGNPVTDGETLARRAELFAERGGFYYRHWDELYERWVEKVDAATRELAGLEVPALGEFEPLEVVTEARGIGSAFELLAAYDRLLQSFDRIWQLHFELNVLGYGAYLVFYELCRQLFPAISDQAVAKMVSGIDVLVLRPDEELRRLARKALELAIGDFVKAAESEETLRNALAGSDAGRDWLADLEMTKDPWFYFSFGNGLAHDHRSWIDDPSLAIRTIGEYVDRLEAGEEIDRPRAAVAAERDRITDEYRALLPDESRHTFDDHLGLCRTVFPFIENHNFYVEHRYLTVFWNKARGFGELLARDGFLDDREDVFLLRHDEVREALAELRIEWGSAGAGVPRGPRYWPPLVAKRKRIYEAAREWAPPAALGEVPEAITDPSIAMLWGISVRRLETWLDDRLDDDAVSGVAGSPGVAEGRARVILHTGDLAEIEAGEILVAPSTSTSWTPVFGKIAGAVLDTGGIMCHAAIVAREYGLPAVVGTGTATKRIKTGDRLRVDADAGVVTIL